MKVTLLHPDIQDNNAFKEKVSGMAAALCIGKLKTSLSYTDNLQTAINANHLSIIEHLPLSFLIEDISRVTLSQLSRHRHISLSVLSQRYAKVNTDKNWYIKPESINDNNDPFHKYDLALQGLGSIYNSLIESGVPEEDARYILPNACYTSLVISMNARAFVEACTKRICNKSQWEIRELFIQIKNLIEHIYPNIYALCLPNCEKECGCLETNPCN